MKTLLICWDQRKKKHLGEYYDEIFWVKNDFIDNNYANSLNSNYKVDTIDSYVPRIRDAIRLTYQHAKEDEDKSVQIHLDCSPVFRCICENLQIEMESAENIKIKIV